MLGGTGTCDWHVPSERGRERLRELADNNENRPGNEAEADSGVHVRARRNVRLGWFGQAG